MMRPFGAPAVRLMVGQQQRSAMVGGQNVTIALGACVVGVNVASMWESGNACVRMEANQDARCIGYANSRYLDFRIELRR